MAGSVPLPPESTLPWPLSDPRAGPRAQEPKQEAGDRGEPVLEAYGHQELLFKKYKVFWKKKEKVYI